jgi:methyl coenzyme M reductase gamma subunit
VETLKTRLASKNCEERRVTEVSRCVIAPCDCACASVTDPCWIGIQGVKCHGSMLRGDCACPSVTDPCWIGIQGVKCHGSMLRGDCACASVTDPCWIGIQGVKCHGSMLGDQMSRIHAREVDAILLRIHVGGRVCQVKNVFCEKIGVDEGEARNG